MGYSGKLGWWNSGVYPLYGLLYNWFAVNDAKGLAPEGWHVPTETEKQTLCTYLGGLPVAGGKLKETGYAFWNSPNTGATNSSKLHFIGNGYRAYSAGGAFNSFKEEGSIWTSSTYTGDTTLAHVMGLMYNSAVVTSTYFNKKYGIAVRCIKDNSNGWHEGYVLKDIDNNSYNTILVGTRIWMVQNLKTTKYKDGTTIPEITNGTTWTGLSTGALCAFNNDWSLV